LEAPTPDLWRGGRSIDTDLLTADLLTAVTSANWPKYNGAKIERTRSVVDDRFGLREFIQRCVLVACGVVTLPQVLLAFLALDDITTDNDTDFTEEYSILLSVAIWCLVVALSLTGMRRFVLRGTCMVVLAAAVLGQRSIGPGTVPSWQPAYVSTVAALGWFLVLSLWLVVSGFMPTRRHVRHGP